MNLSRGILGIALCAIVQTLGCYASHSTERFAEAPDAAAPDSPSPDLAPAAPAVIEHPVCTSEARLLEPARRGSCWIDVEATTLVGVLTMPCDGSDGAAQLTLGARVFRGDVESGLLTLTLTTTFDWMDGCEWMSTQTIHGDANAETLPFEYTEAPSPGQLGCNPRCQSESVLEISPTLH